MSLLQQVRAQVTVDVDSMDPLVAQRHTSDGIKFHDMTSNQAIVAGEAARSERRALLDQAVEAALKENAGKDEGGEAVVGRVLDIFTVLLAKEVYPYLTGRVHAQTAPAVAYDTEGTIAHAKQLVATFQTYSIPKERVCIKIPATPESIVAMAYLEKAGIRTLATTLFSVPQALAASQAGCLYVAPYFNELRVHFEPTIWKEYKNTAKEHPASPVIRDIVKAFQKINSKTLVMPASIVTSAEVVALVSLEPNHLTLSGAVLDQLAAQPVTSEPSDAPHPHHDNVSLDTSPAYTSSNGGSGAKVEADTTTGYLADGANALRAAIAADEETSRKLADALLIFGEMEEKTKVLVRDLLAAKR